MKKTISVFILAACVAGCGDDAGRKDAARGDAAAAAKDQAAAAKFYSAATEKGATNREVLVKLAVAASASGDVESAKKAAGEAQEADPSSAEACFAAGQAAYLAKNYAAARSAFTSIVSEKSLPEALRAQAMAAGAVVDIADNRFDEARVALWRAIRLDRRCAPAWYHLGYLSRNTYRFEAAAIDQYEMAGRLMGTDSRARDIQRTVLPALRESVRLRLSTKPGASARDPKASAVLVTEAEKALAKKQLKRAREKFEAASRKDPCSYAAAWNLAKLLAGLKGADVKKTLDAFSDAIDAKPSMQAVYQSAARFALQNARGMVAEKLLSQALAHDFENKATLELYITALGKNGKTKAAALYKAYRAELK